MIFKLKELGEIITGNTPSKSINEYWDSPDICFIKPDIIGDSGITEISESSEYISEAARSKARIVGDNALFITCIGSIGKIGIAMSGEYAFNQQINAIVPNTKVNPRYLAYAILHSKERLSAIANAPVVPIINKTQFGDFELKIDADSDKQAEIVYVLDTVAAIIEMRRHQLYTCDQLIKARFVEMFGDPVHNSAKLPVLPMTEVCEIIDGDRGKNYPKQEEFYEKEYCLFLNAKNVTSHGFDFSECMFITKGKDEMLRKGKLRRGDVVLTTRGTLGNLAFYTDAVPFENVRINSGMVILRMNKEIMNECFFIEQFRMQVEDIKKSIASGSAQPQLPISTMNKIIMLLPDMNRQKQFAAFVSQVDKSKLTIQASLDQLEALKQSLMQKYFG